MTHKNIAMAFLLSCLRKARSDQGGEFVRDSTGATDFFRLPSGGKVKLPGAARHAGEA